jgi:hypothetical protein
MKLRRKAMKNGNRTSVRKILFGGIVAALAFSCTAGAVQSTTTPSSAMFSYNLAGGAVTGNYLPPANQAVLVMGTCLTPGVRGVGHVSLLRIANPGGFIEWSGINSTGSGTVAHGFSPTAGTKIVQIDFSGGAQIEVGSTGDTIRIHNTTTSARAGNMTWVW